MIDPQKYMEYQLRKDYSNWYTRQLQLRSTSEEPPTYEEWLKINDLIKEDTLSIENKIFGQDINPTNSLLIVGNKQNNPPKE